MNELTLPEQETALAPPAVVTNGSPPPDAKALRTEAVGALLSGAYAGASTLKLKADEVKKLIEDFPDDVIEIRPFDGLIYLPHMILRQRRKEGFHWLKMVDIDPDPNGQAKEKKDHKHCGRDAQNQRNEFCFFLHKAQSIRRCRTHCKLKSKKMLAMIFPPVKFGAQ